MNSLIKGLIFSLAAASLIASTVSAAPAGKNARKVEVSKKQQQDKILEEKSELEGLAKEITLELGTKTENESLKLALTKARKASTSFSRVVTSSKNSKIDKKLATEIVTEVAKTALRLNAEGGIAGLQNTGVRALVSACNRALEGEFSSPEVALNALKTVRTRAKNEKVEMSEAYQRQYKTEKERQDIEEFCKNG